MTTIGTPTDTTGFDTAELDVVGSGSAHHTRSHTPGTHTVRWVGQELTHDEFVLRYVQPALVGLIDGTVSTLAPVFAAALYAGPFTAFLVGIATALGAGVSMGWSEALSDTGAQTGRGPGILRGAVTGTATTIGGLFHTLPFLIPSLGLSLGVALAVVVVELFVIAWIRNRFLHVSMTNSLLTVTVGGLIVLGIGLMVGRVG